MPEEADSTVNTAKPNETTSDAIKNFFTPAVIISIVVYWVCFLPISYMSGYLSYFGAKLDWFDIGVMSAVAFGYKPLLYLFLGYSVFGLVVLYSAFSGMFLGSVMADNVIYSKYGIKEPPILKRHERPRRVIFFLPVLALPIYIVETFNHFHVLKDVIDNSEESKLFRLVLFLGLFVLPPFLLISYWYTEYFNRLRKLQNSIQAHPVDSKNGESVETKEYIVEIVSQTSYSPIPKFTIGETIYYLVIGYVVMSYFSTYWSGYNHAKDYMKLIEASGNTPSLIFTDGNSAIIRKIDADGKPEVVYQKLGEHFEIILEGKPKN